MATNIIDHFLSYADIEPEKPIFHFLDSELEIKSILTLGDIKTGLECSIGSLLPFSETPCLIVLPKSPDFVYAFLTCLAAGVYAVPLSSPVRSKLDPRIKSVAHDSGAKIVISNHLIYENLAKEEKNKAFLDSLQWLFVEELISAPAQPQLLRNTQRSGIAFLQYTSGSTGNPKGVMVSHQNILHNSAFIQQSFGNNGTTRGFCWLPIFHDMGLIEGVIQPLFSNYPVFHLEPRDFVVRPIRWLEGMSRYQATVSGGPNFAYKLCIKRCRPEQIKNLNLSQIKVLFNGAEMVRAATIEQFCDQFASLGIIEEQFVPCYGMAETTLAITLCSPKEKIIHTTCSLIEDKDPQQFVSVGRSSLGIVVKIVSPETLETLADGKIGEIWVKGDSNCLGYWKRENDGTFDNILNGAHGFLRTGDLGFLKKEELFIAGRSKDLIIVNGVNYYPEDIEQQLSVIHPATDGCGMAAFSIDIDDKECVIFALEVSPSTYKNKAEQKRIVLELKKAFFMNFGFTLTELVLIRPFSLPRTTSGKISRSASRKHHEEQSLKTVPTIAS